MQDQFLLRNPDVKSTLLPDGNLVLFNATNDWAHTLNPVAALVWEFADGEHCLGTIISEILSLGDVFQKDVLSRQVESLVTEMLDSGLLQSVSAADRSGLAERAE